MLDQDQDDQDNPANSKAAPNPCIINFGYLGRPAKYTRQLFEGSFTRIADGDPKLVLFTVQHEDDDQIDVRFPTGAVASTASGSSICLERQFSPSQRQFLTFDQRAGFPRSPSSDDYNPLPNMEYNQEGGLTTTWYKKDIEDEELGVFGVFGRVHTHIHPAGGRKEMSPAPTCSVRVEWGNCWMTVSRELRSEYSDELYDTIISLEPTTDLPRSTVPLLPAILEEQE
ncbi:hypothetical protein BU16DRAFT_543465 [Lophium mytilinum]|uniref:Uncharacterized protein n=1 Tax=Lophium mytilinum TaxID=390894 RepID=A0A6A6QFP6_9PEZI|nr:hypothetical protein BU16DRAFT_543465 [Lophium mytilinum]